jgi:hypothetical protein
MVGRPPNGGGRRGGHEDSVGGESADWAVRGVECRVIVYVSSPALPNTCKTVTTRRSIGPALEKWSNRPFLSGQFLVRFKGISNGAMETDVFGPFASARIKKQLQRLDAK